MDQLLKSKEYCFLQFRFYIGDGFRHLVLRRNGKYRPSVDRPWTYYSSSRSMDRLSGNSHFSYTQLRYFHPNRTPGKTTYSHARYGDELHAGMVSVLVHKIPPPRSSTQNLYTCVGVCVCVCVRELVSVCVRACECVCAEGMCVFVLVVVAKYCL